MNLNKVLLYTGVLFLLLAYLFYEPLPQGLEGKWKIVPTIVAMKIIRYIAYSMSLFGYSECGIFKIMLNFIEEKSLPVSSHPNMMFEEMVFDGVPVRVYQPKKLINSNRAIVYYHGGGFTIGSMNTYHQSALNIGVDLNAVVVSVGYRLAPEFPFPVPFEDCEKATIYFLKHAVEYNVDRKRVALMGQSAGGSLAAGIAISLSEMDIQNPKMQVLIYPATQLVNLNTPSHFANAKGPLLDRDLISLFYAAYVFGDKYYEFKPHFANNSFSSTAIRKEYYKNIMNLDALPRDDIFEKYVLYDDKGTEIELWNKWSSLLTNYRLSPLLYKDFSKVPPAYISTCQFDVLRDDGFFYADRLKLFGVDVHHDHVDHCYHGWFKYHNQTVQLNIEYNKVIKFINENL